MHAEASPAELPEISLHVGRLDGFRIEWLSLVDDDDLEPGVVGQNLEIDSFRRGKLVRVLDHIRASLVDGKHDLSGGFLIEPEPKGGFEDKVPDEVQFPRLARDMEGFGRSD